MGGIRTLADSDQVTITPALRSAQIFAGALFILVPKPLDAPLKPSKIYNLPQPNPREFAKKTGNVSPVVHCLFPLPEGQARPEFTSGLFQRGQRVRTVAGVMTVNNLLKVQ